MIYFDNASTTKINPEVLKTYEFLLREYYANPSNSHAAALKVNNLLLKARKEIKKQLGVTKAKLIFTSGATEANNLILFGAFGHYSSRGKKIIISKGEHSSVRNSCYHLAERFGAEIVDIALNSDGRVNLQELESALTKDTILVSIIAVNNETGVINDLAKISELVRRMPHTLFHSDVTQAVGKIKLNYDLLDAFSLSSHKLHGLKGLGALVVKKHITLTPVTFGGGQEHGFRSGTINAPANITLSKTIRLMHENLRDETAKVTKLATRLTNYLVAHPEFYTVNSSLTNPFIVNFSLKKHKAAIIQNALSDVGIMISTTSACSDKTNAMSPTVFAMTHDIDRALNTIRVSFSIYNEISEVELFIKTLEKLMKEVRYGN
ncbi:MAG TPA: cysteine desulfurase family protein [Bacilli bacterium]|nr:cysteine desulfurase family protein [Bacilli bacterium]